MILKVLSGFCEISLFEKCAANVTLICLNPSNNVTRGINESFGFAISQKKNINTSKKNKYGKVRPRKPTGHQCCGFKYGANSVSKYIIQTTTVRITRNFFIARRTILAMNKNNELK
jgi:hypothetical protein